jgi:hypothetical protein
MGKSQKRDIDAIFNHITTACFNLGMHVRQTDLPEATRDAIVTSIDELTL